MPVLKNQKPAAAPAKAPAQGTKAAPVTRGVDPFAAKYAETEAATGSGYVPPPPGKYEAIIVEAQGVREDEPSQKQYVFFDLVLVNCEDDALNGKKIKIFFNFTKENGEEDQGMPYFKAANEMLGGTPPTSWEDMCDTLAEIAKAQLWVNINVVENRKKGKTYTNAYLDSVPENQDDKPELPD